MASVPLGRRRGRARKRRFMGVVKEEVKVAGVRGERLPRTRADEAADWLWPPLEELLPPQE